MRMLPFYSTVEALFKFNRDNKFQIRLCFFSSFSTVSKCFLSLGLNLVNMAVFFLVTDYSEHDSYWQYRTKLRDTHSGHPERKLSSVFLRPSQAGRLQALFSISGETKLCQKRSAANALFGCAESLRCLIIHSELTNSSKVYLFRFRHSKAGSLFF